MNEKIKELAKLANPVFDNEFGFMKHSLVGARAVEKFAVAIILECCKEIKEEPFNAGAASDWLT